MKTLSIIGYIGMIGGLIAFGRDAESFLIIASGHLVAGPGASAVSLATDYFRSPQLSFGG